MDAQSGGQRQLSRGVPPADMGVFMGQHIRHDLPILPIDAFGQQNHRAKQAIGQRRRNAIRLPKNRRTAERAGLRPAPGLLIFHRQGLPKLPTAFEIGRQKIAAQGQSAGQPNHPPPVQRQIAGKAPGLCNRLAFYDVPSLDCRQSRPFPWLRRVRKDGKQGKRNGKQQPDQNQLP